MPLHIVQDDRQSEDLPLGSRGGIAVHYTAPVDGEYLIKVKLRRQYQDYLMGMGWAQQLDVRVDGKLVKRFTVGGSAQGRAAAASYAGDGEPNFAGDPEWEEYMQTGGDAASRAARADESRSACCWVCRSCASCWSRRACRSRCSAVAC